MKIKIEPGLFEWGGWFPKIPTFMTPEALASFGLPVDLAYKPFISPEHLSTSETLNEYYDRSYHITKALMDRHQEGKQPMYWNSKTA